MKPPLRFQQLYKTGAVVMIQEVPLTAPAVWLVDIQQFTFPVQSQRWYASGLITNEELAKASCYVSVRAQMHYLAGRALVRHALMGSVYSSPQQIHIVLGENNKPVLAKKSNEVQWHFNISHSGDFVVCALANSKIGIDIEMISPTVDYLSIAYAHFSENEASWIASKPVGINERFMALWTIKEAYLKALGIGLAIPISRVKTTGVKLRACQVYSDDVSNRNKWYCRFAKLESGYWLAICCENALENIKIERANL